MPMKLTAFRFYFLPVFLIFCGCISSYVPSEHEIGANRIPPFKPSGSVRLTNAQESSKDTSITISPSTFTVNYRKYTEIAIRLLKRELRKKGTIVSGYGAKEIKLAIVDLRVNRMPGTMRCFVNYTVKTGDGYVRGNEVVGASWDFQTAIDMAVANVAVGVLNDEKILNFLEK
jgi:hypothetical protein